METTLAYIVPEFTANILLPVIMFLYLLTLDWRSCLQEARVASFEKWNSRECTSIR